MWEEEYYLYNIYIMSAQLEEIQIMCLHLLIAAITSLTESKEARFTCFTK